MRDVHCVIIYCVARYCYNLKKISCHRSQFVQCGTVPTITSRTKRLRVMNLDEAKIRVVIFPVDKIIWNPLQRILRYSTVVTNE